MYEWALFLILHDSAHVQVRCAAKAACPLPCSHRLSRRLRACGARLRPARFALPRSARSHPASPPLACLRSARARPCGPCPRSPSAATRAVAGAQLCVDFFLSEKTLPHYIAAIRAFRFRNARTHFEGDVELIQCASAPARSCAPYPPSLLGLRHAHVPICPARLRARRSLCSARACHGEQGARRGDVPVDWPL